MPYFSNQRGGDERTDWGFAFTSSYLIKGEGKEARYHYTMTPEVVKRRTYHRGDKKQKRILSLPVGLLTGRLRRDRAKL